MVQLLRKTVWKFLRKLKMDIPFNPAITFLGIYPKEKKAEESVGMEREAKEEKCGVKGRRRGGGREKN